MPGEAPTPGPNPPGRPPRLEFAARKTRFRTQRSITLIRGMLPTVLLGETSRYLGGGAATTVGATAVGPSIATLREHPELVDRAAAQGRAMYCWTVDHYEDIEFCRELGVGWIATNHPGRTKSWLQNGLTGADRD